MNPLKAIGGALKAGGKGALKGMKFGYRQVTRPEVMAAVRIGGVFIPGLSALGVLTVLQKVKAAEAVFAGPGTGMSKARAVLVAMNDMMPQLKAWGVPTSEWKDYIETAVLLMQGKATLVSELDGKELLESDIDALAVLFEAS